MFTHNIAARAGAVRNAACVGRAIDLYPAEPDDDLTQPFRLLRFAPTAVWVEPLESPAPLGDVCGPGAPQNCIPMFLTRAPSKGAIKLPKDDRPVVRGERIASLKCSRHGFQLGDGFCVTDYYAQGLSFKDETWFAHLCKPDHGPLQRASVLVTLTRFADWDRVLAWTPLWPPSASPAEISAVIRAFRRAATPSADLLAEMRRLRAQAQHTREAYPARLRALVEQLFLAPS